MDYDEAALNFQHPHEYDCDMYTEKQCPGLPNIFAISVVHTKVRVATDVNVWLPLLHGSVAAGAWVVAAAVGS